VTCISIKIGFLLMIYAIIENLKNAMACIRGLVYVHYPIILYSFVIPTIHNFIG